MLTREHLVNAAIFMEKVSVQAGKEAYAWVETHSAIMAEVKAIDEKKKYVAGNTSQHANGEPA